MKTSEQAAPTQSIERPQRRLRADAQRNCDRLLQAAAAAFAEHGTDASLDDIARRAGVGIGTLYRHFPTRQALLEAVYREQMEALAAEADSLLGAESPGTALARWLRSVLAHNMAHRGLKEVLMNGEPSEQVTSAKVRMRAAGGALLERAQHAGAVRSDLDIGDLLRLVYSIALANEHAAEGAAAANRCLLVMIDGLRHQDSPAAASK
jgi:AcrR family transcriptional regulator